MITTTPGFSSRSTAQVVPQLPARDGEVMEELKPGFSNSAPADDKAGSVTVQKVEDVPADVKVSEPAVPVKTPAKKAAAKKTAAKKG